ncbi:Potassium-transporting ATPase ATP-binding subunit [Brevundimonas subvibrioides]
MTLNSAIGRDMSAFVRRRDDGRASLDLLVTGARCAGCMSKIERAVSALPGVGSARLNLSTGRLAIEVSDRAIDPDTVIRTLAGLGYPATAYDPGAALQQRDREGRKLILALAVAGFGAMNAMMFSVPLWAGLFDQELGPATRTMMMWMSAAVGAPCAIFAGMTFFQSAWRSLRAGRANMDVPISVGVILTLAISFSETILNGRDAYFDAAVSLLFLLLIGRWLDHRLKASARSAAGDLLALQAPTVCVIDSAGRARSVPLGDVASGDRIRVRPGDRIPVDAILEDGIGVLDNSLLTGESTPERIARGQLCRAGAVNLSGLLTLRAEAGSEDSTLAEIARLIDAGAQSRSRYVRLADRAAALYVPVVHAAALLTFAGGWALGLDPREALIRAVAVLIVTCPCALGLAVPAVQIVASARLFRRGVLVKSGAALERLAEVDHVVFDKTGVLTEGRPVLIETSPVVVSMAAPLARATNHPMARAVARAAGDGPVATDVVEHAGLGVEGLIDGQRARLGRAAFVGVSTLRAAETELWFGFEDGPKVRLRFSDSPRPDAAKTVAALRALGLQRRGPVRRPGERRRSRGAQRGHIGLAIRPAARGEGGGDRSSRRGRTEGPDGRRRTERRRCPGAGPRGDRAGLRDRGQPERRGPGPHPGQSHGRRGSHHRGPVCPPQGAGEFRLRGAVQSGRRAGRHDRTGEPLHRGAGHVGVFAGRHPERAQAQGRAMNILLLLAPFSVLLGLLAVGAFVWTLRAGQYDDVQGAAARILIDEPAPLPPRLPGDVPPQDPPT